MKTTRFSVKRMALDAIMIAMFYVLSLFSIQAGGLKFTFSSLPIVLCAAIFGPVDAFLVGTLGAFLEQLLGAYGLTPTTVLWILPHSIRGLFIGLSLLGIRKWISPEAPLDQKGGAWFIGVCLVAAVIVSCLNTLTLYVDSKMFGYYTYALVFGSLVWRIVSGLVVSFGVAVATIPVAKALKKARLVN